MVWGTHEVDYLKSSDGTTKETGKITEELQAIALANNTTIDDVAYLADGNDLAGEHYFYNSTDGITYYSSKSISGSITSIGSDIHGGRTVTIDGSDYTVINSEYKKPYVNIDYFGCIPDGSTLNDDAFNEAATSASTYGFKLSASSGTYLHSSLLQVEDGVTIKGVRGLTTFKCSQAIADVTEAGSAHQGQSIWAKSNTTIQDIVIDGGLFNAGGVLVTGVDNVLLENIVVQNGGTTGVQAFQIYNATNVKILHCSVDQNLHGIQVWLCTNILVDGCTINKVTGGIWSAGATNLEVCNCVISNCQDVGIDFEGGISCTSHDNHVSACYNGELAIFQDGTGTSIGSYELIHRNNTVHRTSTYIKRDGTETAINVGAAGAFFISSMSDNSSNVIFENNTVRVDVDSGRLWYQAANGDDSELIIRNNNFNTSSVSALFRSVDGSNLKYINNTHTINSVVATASEIKNAKGALISSNKFYCVSEPTAYLVYIYTDTADMDDIFFVKNEFYGSGEYALSVDENVSGSLTVSLEKNRLSDKPVNNGGLYINTANGQLRYKDQDLLISLTDETTTSESFDFSSDILATYGSVSCPFVSGVLCLEMGSVQRNMYNINYLSGTVYSPEGSGSGSGVTASATTYATFSGSVVAVTKVIATNQSFFSLRLNTPNI